MHFLVLQENWAGADAVLANVIQLDAASSNPRTSSENFLPGTAPGLKSFANTLDRTTAKETTVPMGRPSGSVASATHTTSSEKKPETATALATLAALPAELLGPASSAVRPPVEPVLSLNTNERTSRAGPVSALSGTEDLQPKSEFRGLPSWELNGFTPASFALNLVTSAVASDVSATNLTIPIADQQLARVGLTEEPTGNVGVAPSTVPLGQNPAVPNGDGNNLRANGQLPGAASLAADVVGADKAVARLVSSPVLPEANRQGPAGFAELADKTRKTTATDTLAKAPEHAGVDGHPGVSAPANTETSADGVNVSHAAAAKLADRAQATQPQTETSTYRTMSPALDVAHPEILQPISFSPTNPSSMSGAVRAPDSSTVPLRVMQVTTSPDRSKTKSDDGFSNLSETNSPSALTTATPSLVMPGSNISRPDIASGPATSAVPTTSAANPVPASRSGTPAGSNQPLQDPVPTPSTQLAGRVELARLVNGAAQSEMHIGLRTEAFGSVKLHTVVHNSQVGLTVGSERGDLRGLLAPEMAGLQAAFRQQHLRFESIRYLATSTGTSGGSSSNGQSQSPPRGQEQVSTSGLLDFDDRVEGPTETEGGMARSARLNVHA